MSRIFGPIFQCGYVVDNIDTALAHWVNVLGVGPFYKDRVEFEWYRYRGERSNPILQVALANSGNLQIELIQQTNEAPSHYRDFLMEHGSGLQHFAVLSNDYDSDMARYATECETLAELKLAGSLRATYLATQAHPGTIVEVVEHLPGFDQVIQTVRDAAKGWDGSDPIRSFSVGGG